MIRIEFTESEREALKYERFHYPDPRVQRKIEVIWLKSCRLSHLEIAQAAGVQPRTVQRILNEYVAGGIERLKENR